MNPMKRHASTLLFFLASCCIVAQTRTSLGEFKVAHFEKEFCARRDSILQTPMDSLDMWCDTLCSKLTFDFVAAGEFARGTIGFFGVLQAIGFV